MEKSNHKLQLPLILSFTILLFGLASWAQTSTSVRGETGKKFQVITHTGYTTCFNYETMQPDWVAWTLTPEHVVSDGNVSRCDEFVPDPLATFPMIDTRAYTRTGYDRGHMAPAADFRWSQTVQDESFYLTNICVQDHTLNEKTWFELEKRCRFWCRNFYKTTLRIVAGPYFNDNPDRVGSSNLPVPAAFWKVIYKCDRGRHEAIGFIFPNKPVDDDWRNYAVSVSDVERLTGLQFYLDVPDLDKASYDLSRWK